VTSLFVRRGRAQRRRAAGCDRSEPDERGRVHRRRSPRSRGEFRRAHRRHVHRRRAHRPRALFKIASAALTRRGDRAVPSSAGYLSVWDTGDCSRVAVLPDDPPLIDLFVLPDGTSAVGFAGTSFSRVDLRTGARTALWLSAAGAFAWPADEPLPATPVATPFVHGSGAVGARGHLAMRRAVLSGHARRRPVTEHQYRSDGSSPLPLFSKTPLQIRRMAAPRCYGRRSPFLDLSNS
jgi:hypothetical protein